jgi:hypothetical protein
MEFNTSQRICTRRANRGPMAAAAAQYRIEARAFRVQCFFVGLVFLNQDFKTFKRHLIGQQLR